MIGEEHPLGGGNSASNVVRIGPTVRKPWSAATPAVVAYMTGLATAGVDVPAALGKDEQGRQVTEFIPGSLASEVPPLTPSDLKRVGGIVRAIHDKSASFVPPQPCFWDELIEAPGSELICHNDLAPWNLIVGDRWVFIDWDGAAPSTRLWDLAYAAQAFTLSDVNLDPHVAAGQLAEFIDGYQADDSLRELLPGTMVERAAAMYDFLHASHRTRREPWSSMFLSGHGRHWKEATQYVDRHIDTWAYALKNPAQQRPTSCHPADTFATY